MPVELVTIRKKTDIILLDNTNTQYSTGKILVGELFGKICMFPKFSGYEAVIADKKIKIIPKGDIICFVEAEEGEIIEVTNEIKNICNPDAEWVNGFTGESM